MSKLEGPEFTAGVRPEELQDGRPLLGHVRDVPAILIRIGGEIVALSAECTHLGGPLKDGLVTAGTIRCPWHHACFNLSSGEAVCGPAFDSLQRWEVDASGALVTVKNSIVKNGVVKNSGTMRPGASLDDPVVIVGGGAAGYAAADMLKRCGRRSLTMVSSDDSPPYDRTLLTKDYLDGSLGDDRLSLGKGDLFSEPEYKLELKRRATRIDLANRRLHLDDGRSLAFSQLLLATGAEPKRADFPGAELPHVCLLRSLTDCREIIARAKTARRAVVVGGSFIGLEAAASLRDRGLEVTVVTPEPRPMERIFGTRLADLVRAAHEQRGVIWKTGSQVESIDPKIVTLRGGFSLEADLVVVGIGVKPRVELAKEAGLAVNDGVLVDERLETSGAGVFAAGDIACWPDPHSGARIRVEHWNVAIRQGQVAALNIAGRRTKFTAVPFFWTKHFDLAIRYLGHAPDRADVAIDGDVAGRDCLATFSKDDRTLAYAAVGRDLVSLRLERSMELTLEGSADAALR